MTKKSSKRTLQLTKLKLSMSEIQSRVKHKLNSVTINNEICSSFVLSDTSDIGDCETKKDYCKLMPLLKFFNFKDFQILFDPLFLLFPSIIFLK